MFASRVYSPFFFLLITIMLSGLYVNRLKLSLLCSVKHLIRFLLVVVSLFTSSYSLAYCYSAEQGSYIETASGTSNGTAATVCRTIIDQAGIAHGGYGALGGTDGGGGSCYYYNPSGAFSTFGEWVRAGTVESLCAGDEPPDPVCPDGQFWDFETESCKYPEDELCPTGSNWNATTQDCVCDGAGILSNASGFRICMQPADDSCSSESADFVGYINGTKPYCSGRARCPSGSVPGAVTVNGVSEYVCVPQPQDDPKCPNGTMGNFNGQTVCVPDPNSDPDCPSGQSGMVNGQKVCIPKPGDPGGCGPGETPGFVGVGADMQPTCVPANYQPETCPAGQYAWNSATDGFACVTIPSTPNVGDDGGPSGPGTGGSGDNTATGSVVTKNPDGTVKETSDIELKLPDGLLQDQPQNNYFKETDEFGDSQLEKLDSQSAQILSDFNGEDGAFTQRYKLEDASNRLLGLFGYSSSCAGDLVFYQSAKASVRATCADLEKMRNLFGWFLYVSTLMGIFNVLMQKQEN